MAVVPLRDVRRRARTPELGPDGDDYSHWSLCAGRAGADDAGRRRRNRPLTRAGERLEKRLACRGQRRFELDRLAARRVDEAQAARMQEHAIEAQRRRWLAARQRPVEREVAVLRIAGDRVARIGEVDPDLVRAAGLDRHVEQAEAGEAARDAHQADRAAAALVVGVDGAHCRLPSAAVSLCKATSITLSDSGQAPTTSAA